MTKRLNLILLALIALIGLPYYWLLLENSPGDAQPKPVSIAQLNQLAASIPGPAPTEIEMELAAFRRLPGNLVAAGSGLKRKLIGVMAFRLPVEGHGSIVIDGGITRSIAECMDMQVFDAGAQGRIDRALKSADLILLTREHPNNIGGVIALAGSKDGSNVTKAVRPGGGQTAFSGSRCEVNWPRGLNLKPVIAAGAPTAVAAGVVVIPAPSHTPGSQMIFVRLANGRSYLFTGDIATLDKNWRELRAGSRLVGNFLAPENRSEIYSWLLTIQKLKREDPSLTIIPGHDFEWLAEPTNKANLVGLMR